MFRTKRELDNYVLETLARIPSEREKITRCFSFALAYCKFREFETARRYLDDYLKSDAPNLNVAHKLMGDILVELNRHEEALEHYKESYARGKTRDVLNKVCALIQNGYGRNETPQTRANWLNLQKATATLRLDSTGSDSSPLISSPKLYTPVPQSGFKYGESPTAASKSAQLSRPLSGTGIFGSAYMSPSRTGAKSAVVSENIGDNLQRLIESNKATVVHHTTLLQFYLTDKKIREAAAHVHNHMLKFASCYEFLEKAVAVMDEATTDTQDVRSVKTVRLSDAETYAAHFLMMENFIGVLLDPNLKDVIPEAVGEKRLDLAAKWIFKFDQQLFLKGRKVRNSPLETWWTPFFKHCQAQLQFFMGILLRHRAKQDGKHLDLYKSCFEAACSFIVDPPLCLIKLRNPKIQQRAFIESCYRILVAESLLNAERSPVTVTAELKDLMYSRCFAKEQSARSTSEFFSTTRETRAMREQLNEEKFALYVKVAQLLYPESLHHQIWLHSRTLQRTGCKVLEDDLPSMHSVCFEEMPLTVTSDRVDADTISQLDVDIFLTLSTAVCWEDLKTKVAVEIPSLLPALATQSQAKWWSSAYRLTHSIACGGSDWAATECRLQVQRGLEMIRNVENTLPYQLLNLAGATLTKAAVVLEQTGVAKQFIHLATSISDLYQLSFNAAENYYRMFVETYMGNSNKKKIFVRFFDLKSFPTISNEKLAVEKALFVLGWRAMERRDFEVALSQFEQTSFAEAALFSAEIYKILAEEELESSAADSGAKYKALLQKTQELIYDTLDRKQAKPIDYLVGKSSAERFRAPLSHPKLSDDAVLQDMLEEVEDTLKELTLNVSMQVQQQSALSLNGLSLALEESLAGRGDGESVTHHPLDEFVIRTPLQKGRRSLLRNAEPDYTSTPKVVMENGGHGDGEKLIEEELAAAAAFADSLEKLLEQNSNILDTIIQMEDEIRDLNDRFENLKKSKKIVLKKLCKSKEM